jgi:hypothetical protein
MKTTLVITYSRPGALVIVAIGEKIDFSSIPLLERRNIVLRLYSSSSVTDKISSGGLTMGLWWFDRLFIMEWPEHRAKSWLNLCGRERRVGIPAGGEGHNCRSRKPPNSRCTVYNRAKRFEQVFSTQQKQDQLRGTM